MARRRQKKSAFDKLLKAKLLDLRSPPLVDEVQLHLATTSDEWRDPEALAAKHGIGMPYWSVAWAGGIVLARYLFANPAFLRGKSVLDFGSGSGLVAIAAARAGAKRVTAADIDPVAADAIAANARSNGVHVEIDVGDWLSVRYRAADIVLAGDCFYDLKESPAILKWLRLQAAFGTDVLLGDSRRPGSPQRNIAIVSELSHITTQRTDDDALARARVLRLC